MTDPSTVPARADAPRLKSNAIGFFDALVIGLASTSPAYTIAAIIGGLVLYTGVHAPGIMLASFVPMLLIASAFYYLNTVDQDCGTTFSWVTRAMGPWFGWIGGWAIAMTGVLIVGSLAEVGVRYSLLTVGLEDLAYDPFWIRVLTIVLIFVMTAICVWGTEISARLQNVLIVFQVLSLLTFAGVALYQVFTNTSAFDSITPSWEWLNPFGGGWTGVTAGLLLGVFAYWGWESSVNLTEETTNSSQAPGKAAIWSTIVLVVTYLSVTIAVVALAGDAFLAETADEEDAIFQVLASDTMGPWAWVVMLSVATSAIASTQTTIIPASRTGLSMARRGAFPKMFGRIHPRFRTPDVSTWWVAGIASAYYLVVGLLSETALWDTLTALGLLIAFYYALTGIACAIYFRKRLTASVKNFVLIGVGPVLGSLLLIWLLVAAIIDYGNPENSYSETAWFGLGPPLVIGIGIFVTGVVLMVIWYFRDRRFWQERPSTAELDIVRFEAERERARATDGAGS
ncbi:APC family permease [Agrococcus terreus]|uniref:Amino acid permease n=1 Tax=Agrococcus terreus TaxID=574649 RepID=A0ABQ2KGJ1_9MICO|nr:APC family permease [Agrococcus terreus]GGN81203.1 putative amino acid permease [Agrococcus terreus]